MLAGGQSLIPPMKLRFASPRVLVDLNRIGELDSSQEDGYLRIGALVRHKECERSELLRSRYGVSATPPADLRPARAQPRHRCGSVAHADPQGDSGSALLAAGGEVVAQGPSGEREIPLSELPRPVHDDARADGGGHRGRVPDPGPRTGGSYLKLERKVGDFATAAVGVQLSSTAAARSRGPGSRSPPSAREHPRREAEQALAGAEPGDDAFAEAARLAAEEAEPQADHRGTVEYKRNVIRVFVERGLKAAAASAAS